MTKQERVKKKYQKVRKSLKRNLVLQLRLIKLYEKASMQQDLQAEKKAKEETQELLKGAHEHYISERRKAKKSRWWYW